jgi:predicted nucleic acid-binding protein
VQQVRGAIFLEAVPPLAIPESILRWDLGKGESSVLAWVTETHGATALLDDMAGRELSPLFQSYKNEQPANIGVARRRTLRALSVSRRPVALP